MFVARADDDALAHLDVALQASTGDARLVAVGEIGLDYFVPELAAPGALRERQEYFYREQLKLARRHGLPVVLHVRRSVDQILKGLRAVGVAGGIAHAFNGSRQQAQTFIDLGFKLGFGGAMTWPRATRLRQLAAELPLESIVLETDAPDMSPVWRQGQRNSPDQLLPIAESLAALRFLPLASVLESTTANARIGKLGLWYRHNYRFGNTIGSCNFGQSWFGDTLFIRLVIFVVDVRFLRTAYRSNQDNRYNYAACKAQSSLHPTTKICL